MLSNLRTTPRINISDGASPSKKWCLPVLHTLLSISLLTGALQLRPKIPLNAIWSSIVTCPKYLYQCQLNFEMLFQKIPRTKLEPLACSVYFLPLPNWSKLEPLACFGAVRYRGLPALMGDSVNRDTSNSSSMKRCWNPRRRAKNTGAIFRNRAQASAPAIAFCCGEPWCRGNTSCQAAGPARLSWF
jgi:hypothetical protein